MKPIKHAAVYYRVSTDHQDFESQKHAIEQWLSIQPEKPEKLTVISDMAISGANTNRPGYKKLLDLAKKGVIDTVIVYRLDRFSRDASTAIRAILNLDDMGVAFISVSQPVLNFGHNMPFRKTMIAAFAEIAELERDTIRARVKSGMDAAKKRGVRFGKAPMVSKDLADQVKELRTKGLSFREIAVALNISHSLAHKASKYEDSPLITAN